jgi:hypothetical protein
MHPSDFSVLVSRSVVVILMALVWGLYFLNARLAYKSFPRRRLLQLGTVVATVAIFCIQVFTMNCLSPEDASGNHFFIFIVAECGGAMLVLFSTLVRERGKARSHPSGPGRRP